MRVVGSGSARRLLGVACLAAVLLGCGGKPKLCEVSGEATYQGAPVADGAIVFEDIAGAAPPAYAKIAGGQYRLSTTPGEKRVRITATKETGKTFTDSLGSKIAERIDLIPPPYNSATTLTATVSPGGKQTLDFRLP